ncbi:alcohol dehydrogenase catalytic domain-containing protein [Streptomyces sp. 110]|uniref:Alcohol dehydrogenase catalytic domain-containing protein n=1 Tax=Streptomyces endocoffeicus TaxID=2898945 RepID=A0ABS1Q0J4_9ACTN|nr:alcohol dehydrogenase catalytic domain-containing protein [Streptomyces endocoffeicus]MBL1118204.1 alcohol dehydrogenase catalytic domain-containing protein [Streptomyces endocoffeicus]
MQALVMKESWKLEVEDLPAPVPGPGEALLRIIATGICGSDIHGFTGENGRRHPGQVMGHETVGRIVALGAGSEAHDLAEGRLVTVNPVISCGQCTACQTDAQQRCPARRVIGVDPALRSAFAELMTAPAGNLVPLPDSVPDEHGALIEPLAVGYHAAVRGGCAPGDRVLVIGGGPIGQATALAALRMGADAVVVSEPHPERRGILARLGLTAVDPAAGDLTELVRDALGRPTLTLDAVGATSTLADALAVTDLGSRVVLVGMHAPRVDLPAYAVSTEERSLIGSFCYSAGEFAQTARWVAETDRDLSALVDGRVDLASAASSFAALARGENQASKVLVYPHGAPDTATHPHPATTAAEENRE